MNYTEKIKLTVLFTIVILEFLLCIWVLWNGFMKVTNEINSNHKDLVTILKDSTTTISTNNH
jgi:hypothetical protein